MGDVLTQKTHNEALGYTLVGGENALLVSFDPVAVDAAGLPMAVRTIEASDQDPTPINVYSRSWLSYADKIGLGAGEQENLRITEVALK